VKCRHDNDVCDCQAKGFIVKFAKARNSEMKASSNNSNEVDTVMQNIGKLAAAVVEDHPLLFVLKHL
jgi:hypothetical protein